MSNKTLLKTLIISVITILVLGSVTLTCTGNGTLPTESDSTDVSAS